MRLIKPSFEIWEQEPGIQGIYKAIERAGRICYKSSPKYRWYSEDGTMWVNEGTEDWRQLKDNYPIKGENISAKSFVEKMVKSGHGAMLEHGTVYLYVPYDYYNTPDDIEELEEFYLTNPYSKVNSVMNFDCGYPAQGDRGTELYITSNYRVLVEHNRLDDLKYLCGFTKHHERRITVHFVCDRGILAEYTRHRVFSFAAESTRYCNYSNKDKFGGEVTFIEPCWLEDYNYDGNTYTQIFLDSLKAAESGYLDLLKKWDDKIPDKRYKTGFRNNPWTPQQARAVLPNALKTELVMTGFVSDWGNFFELRTPVNAHPQARELAIPLREEFVKRELIK